MVMKFAYALHPLSENLETRLRTRPQISVVIRALLLRSHCSTLFVISLLEVIHRKRNRIDTSMRLDPEHSSSGNRNDIARVESVNGDEAAVFAPKTVERGDGNKVETGNRKSSEPHESMEFESKEEAFKFYKEHAISAGFNAIIKASRRSRISGKFIDAKFVCTRYGTKPGTSVTENSPPVKKKRGRINRSWSKTDCKACMHVKRRQDGRWIVSSFVGEHNHDLVIEQAALRNVCNSNGVVQSRRKKVRLGLPLALRESNGLSSGGSSLGFQGGDAQVLLEYVSCMQDENPYFFYAVDLNKEQLLRNVFWVDAKARIDYVSFGDVVLFDTPYKRNESKLPFVPFIGMNNHFEFLLLGCAFVADGSSKSSYAWLLRAWLRSMHGRAPKVILTDQDPMLKEAIAEVLPGSRHCFCLWHILSKIQEKLGYVMRQHEKFISKFYKCILKSQTEEQFEKRWGKLVDRFELTSDKWIESLHNDRLRWVPMYMKDTFLAGLSSPPRLESVVSLLDKCLLRKTSLNEFLHQYNVMLQERYEDEARADFDSWHRQPGLKSPSPYGKQMAQIYTHAVFKKFQVEVLGVVACHPKVESKDDATTIFKVHDLEENHVFRVIWNEETSDTSCACRMFEYNGFLCRHVMIVLQISGVNSIPDKYILRRWTKSIKNREAVRQVDPIESRNERYKDLYQRACKLGNEASVCQETFRIAFAALEEALRKCESINNSVQTLSDPSSPSNYALHESEELTRGKTKTEEMVSGKEKVYLEQEATATGLHWDQMGYLNVRASGLDCSYGPQQTERGMGQLNLRGPTLGGMAGNLENVSMGQWNSTASSQDAHHLHVERLHQMDIILLERISIRLKNREVCAYPPNMQETARNPKLDDNRIEFMWWRCLKLVHQKRTFHFQMIRAGRFECLATSNAELLHASRKPLTCHNSNGHVCWSY